MLSYLLDFSSCAIRDDFCKSSHIFTCYQSLFSPITSKDENEDRSKASKSHHIHVVIVINTPPQICVCSYTVK